MTLQSTILHFRNIHTQLAMKNLFFAFFLMGQFVAVSSQQTREEFLIHDDIRRDYILYIPASYTGNTPVPLLFNFHGSTMSASRQMSMCDFRPVADNAGFIVVHPQGTKLNGSSHWNVEGLTVGSTTDDIGFTEALLDAISDGYNIDSTRVYGAGYSNGGYFCFRLACQLSNRFAAVASVGGSMTVETITNCSPKHPTPVLQIHGTNDGSVSYEGETWSLPVEEALQHWINYNHCNATPTIEDIPNTSTTDYSTVEHYIYSGGDKDVNTEHFKVIGGDHDWPGSTGNMDIDASSEIWKFFSRYNIHGSRWPAGIDPENEHNNHLKIYPNPALSSITIETDSKPGLKYRLSSLAGQPVAEGSLATNPYEIDLSNLPAGIYILRIGESACKVLKSK